MKHDNTKPLFLVPTSQQSNTSEIDKTIGLAHLKFGKSTRLWNQKAGPVFSKVKRGRSNCGSRIRNELKSRNDIEYPPQHMNLEQITDLNKQMIKDSQPNRAYSQMSNNRSIHTGISWQQQPDMPTQMEPKSSSKEIHLIGLSNKKIQLERMADENETLAKESAHSEF